MPFNAFNRLFGTAQGRSQPTNWLAPNGDYVFVLGSDLPGDHQVFLPNDLISIEQASVLTPTTLIRVSARTRAPTVIMPAGYKWVAYVLLSGLVHWKYIFEANGRVVDTHDIVIPVGSFVGSKTLTFELRLESTFTPDPLETELPAFYIDAILLDVATSPQIVLGDRVPEPNEVGVPANTRLFIRLLDRSNANDPVIDKIYVNGVLAFNGLFQPGFTGFTFFPAPGVYGMELIPSVPFLPESIVTVRVQGHDDTTTYFLDETYQFTVIDSGAPTVVAAESIAIDAVRITFSEPMTALDPTNSADALNPANYALDPQSTPAVTPTFTLVTQVTPAVFDLTPSIPLSPGIQYILASINVTDIHDNVISTPNSAFLTAFFPPQPGLRSFDLYRMFPQETRRQDLAKGLDLKRFIACLQDVVWLLLYDIDRFSDILDPDFAPESFVDVMLLDLGNPFPFDLTLIDKRRLLRVLVDMYKAKGTKQGIIDIIRFFVGIEVDLLAYWEEEVIGLGDFELEGDWVLGAEAGSPILYSFEIVCPILITDEQLDRIIRIATYAKPAHTHLIQVVTPGEVILIDHLELGLSRLDDTFMLH